MSAKRLGYRATTAASRPFTESCAGRWTVTPSVRVATRTRIPLDGFLDGHPVVDESSIGIPGGTGVHPDPDPPWGLRPPESSAAAIASSSATSAASHVRGNLVRRRWNGNNQSVW